MPVNDEYFYVEPSGIEDGNPAASHSKTDWSVMAVSCIEYAVQIRQRRNIEIILQTSSTPLKKMDAMQFEWHGIIDLKFIFYVIESGCWSIHW